MRVVNYTARHDAMQKLRLHQYWLEKHALRRMEAAIAALNAGASRNMVAKAIGVDDMTLGRHGIVAGADPSEIEWLGLCGGNGQNKKTR